jgi:hypothetical protein
MKQPTALHVVALMFLCSRAIAASPKPVKAAKPVTEIGLSEITAGTFENLWRDSVAVARVHVFSAQARTESNPLAPASSQSVVTEASVEVLETYKGAPATSEAKRMKVYQIGGVAETPDKILSVANVRPLRPGAEYLIFLGWNDYFNRWMVRGSEGVYEIRGGRLHAYGDTHLAKERDGARMNNVSNELRLIAARSKE